MVPETPVIGVALREKFDRMDTLLVIALVHPGSRIKEEREIALTVAC